jgi:hypothetical protein
MVSIFCVDNYAVSHLGWLGPHWDRNPFIVHPKARRRFEFWNPVAIRGLERQLLNLPRQVRLEAIPRPILHALTGEAQRAHDELAHRTGYYGSVRTQRRVTH